MKVLIACEFSGVVRDAFRRRGHQAWSCDILPADPSPFQKYHFNRDVLGLLKQPWDLVIAHPPCTYITNAGVRHLHSVPSRNGVLPKIHGEERWKLMRQASQFFAEFLNCRCNKVCVENPVPHRYAKEIIGQYTQLIQPWQFGHGETKATCLWLKNLPILVPTKIVEGRVARIHMMPPSADRGKLRSITYTGIAEAMADQWGTL